MTKDQLDHERLQEAVRVTEAYGIAWERAEAALRAAQASGDKQDTRLAERRAVQAHNQLSAAQDREDDLRGLTRPVRPGAGKR